MQTQAKIQTLMELVRNKKFQRNFNVHAPRVPDIAVTATLTEKKINALYTTPS